MAMIRNCEICGAKFKARGNNHKVCSNCQKVAYHKWKENRKQKKMAVDLYNKPDHLADKVKEINEYNQKKRNAL